MIVRFGLDWPGVIHRAYPATVVTATVGHVNAGVKFVNRAEAG